MTRKISFSILDIVNLAVGKGANFIVVFVVLFVASRSRNSVNYLEFVFWWSMASLVGGAVFGGLSTACVRSVAVDGQLVPRDIRVLVRRRFVLIAVVTATTIVLMSRAGWTNAAITALVGLSFQAFQSTIAVARALRATVLSVATSLVCIVLTFASQFGVLAIGAGELVPQFTGMAVAYLVAAAFGAVSVRGLLATAAERPESDEAARNFWHVTAVFSIGSAFVSFLVMVDFLVMKWFGLTGDIAIVADAKAYFERFALPILLMVMSAGSLSILREPYGRDTLRATAFNLPVGGRRILIATIAFVGLLAGYAVYRGVFQIDIPTPALWVLVAGGLGYMCYALSGLTLDIFLLTSTPSQVLISIGVFLAIYVPLQIIFMSTVGGAAWAPIWLLANLVILWFTSRNRVQWKWSAP